ncbi:hypothetical protein PR202_gn00095 [Eleusine coracana subsp. coracana]|uniref:Uncharacterized protein n=1 Tax=Eleusine coracana subsp. coracana TaxID=191504 RepID=A0AAV5G189_ELECO|nr:hypothetical protein PR202_gb20033 [Eleusine coracana subsp. coracana]GJN40793.1 hypothetical protein PR202_gn00095 [Eleusine coracana subsp. coracana]
MRARDRGPSSAVGGLRAQGASKTPFDQLAHDVRVSRSPAAALTERRLGGGSEASPRTRLSAPLLPSSLGSSRVHITGCSLCSGASAKLEAVEVEHPPRIKFKRPDKTARHIMNILNKEAVEKVRSEREIPDVQPGCIIQMRLQVPENKRRESTLKGIVIGRRNAGINTTFRLRRLVAGVGVESVFPL